MIASLCGQFPKRGAIVDTGTSLERGEEWVSVERLIALARRAHRTELPPGRKEVIREQLLRRWERERDRRRTARAFLAGAMATLLVGALLRLVSGGLPSSGRSEEALARKAAMQHTVAE